MKEGYDLSKATLGAKYYRNKEGRGCCEVQRVLSGSIPDDT